MKVALVHDYLNQYGGAERVLEALHEMYPEAPIFTSVYDQAAMASLGFKTEGKDIRTSFMQTLPLRKRLPRYYFTLFYPHAFRSFDLSDYDLIISSASYAAKYIKKPQHAVHICYCHTPPRFLYGYDTDSSAKMNWLERQLSSIWKIYLKRLDQKYAKGVDVWVANSNSIKDKIKAAYAVDSVVVYPPVDLERFSLGDIKNDGYFFVVSRLGEYKRVDLIVEAFNQLSWPLKVVGRGSQLDYLRQMAKANVEIFDALPDEQVTAMYQQCRAFVIAANEDFGITPVEAMACGKPVIALGQGGFLETVVEGQTGTFFLEQTPQSLMEALRRFDSMRFDPQVIKRRAAEFDLAAFKRHMADLVSQQMPD